MISEEVLQLVTEAGSAGISKEELREETEFRGRVLGGCLAQLSRKDLAYKGSDGLWRAVQPSTFSLEVHGLCNLFTEVEEAWVHSDTASVSVRKGARLRVVDSARFLPGATIVPDATKIVISHKVEGEIAYTETELPGKVVIIEPIN